MILLLLLFDFAVNCRRDLVTGMVAWGCLGGIEGVWLVDEWIERIHCSEQLWVLRDRQVSSWWNVLSLARKIWGRNWEYASYYSKFHKFVVPFPAFRLLVISKTPLLSSDRRRWSILYLSQTSQLFTIMIKQYYHTIFKSLPIESGMIVILLLIPWFSY